MTANEFFEHFATLADAPGGIPKLRDLILQLAIQGKLCPQQPDDEPVSHFLASIDTQKTATSNGRRQRNVEPALPVKESDQPFPIPPTWTWKRFADVTINRDDERVPIESGIRETRRGEFDYYGASGVIDKIDDYLFDKPLLLIGEDGANLVNRSTPIAFVAKGKYWVNNHAHVLDSVSLDALRYVEVFINAIDLKPYLTGTAQPKMNQAKMNSIPVAVPPLPEQKRIVAKVDRLMTLCDALEAQQQARHAVRCRLHATLLGNLQTAANAADFARAWQRLRDHFAELFTPGEAALDAVAQLRRTILHLAVQGKLVPQVADDEPVSELLGRIREERERLVESGGLKDAPPLEPIAEKELLFSIPPSWQWVRAGDICRGITSGTTPPQAVFQASPDSAIPYLKVYNIRNQRVDFEYKPQYIAETFHRAKMKRSTLIPGDVIMNIVGPPLGKVAIIPDSFPEWNCNQAIVFFRLLGKVLPDFLHAYLMEGSYLKNIELIGTAGQDNISVTKSKNIVIPLPPLAEQQRIVVKVQQLMAQCDALEASLKAAATVSERWSAAAVRQLLTAARTALAR